VDMVIDDSEKDVVDIKFIMNLIKLKKHMPQLYAIK
jgi:hypothetical protein